MNCEDECFLLSKRKFRENAIIVNVFTPNKGKVGGIVYGGTSRKQKKNFQIGNKILLHWKSKSENKPGYFNIELVKPIAPAFFDDKKRIACILSSTSILKILLPERQINKTIYRSFEKMLSDLKNENWIEEYIKWELSLIKELGFENINITYKKNIKEALVFNRKLLIENFILPNKLKFPLFRNILEKYYI